VSEPCHVNSFLIEGSAAAALIDTGLGIGNIREVVEELASHDVLAVNTHYHYDHTGGNHWFAKRLIHKVGAAAIERELDPGVYRDYAQFISELADALPRFRQLDKRFFRFLTDDTTPRPLPSGFEPATWKYVPTTATQLLREGDKIELGARDLTVLHTPGHTPDSICLLDERHGVLFGGDTINTGPILDQLPDSDVQAFAASTRRLAELAESVRVVYVAHFARYSADAEFLSEVADGFDRLVNGEVVLHAAAGHVDDTVREARFGRFSILINTQECAPAKQPDAPLAGHSPTPNHRARE
jgi:glyoxylase-like metal-dependent hydrolase (beta-lactamase superfamily II)